MNVEDFRKDLKAYLAQGNKQIELERLSGVPQATICRFVNSTDNRDITLSYALKLWPFVYGKPMDAENVCTR